MAEKKHLARVLHVSSFGDSLSIAVKIGITRVVHPSGGSLGRSQMAGCASLACGVRKNAFCVSQL